MPRNDKENGLKRLGHSVDAVSGSITGGELKNCRNMVNKNVNQCHHRVRLEYIDWSSKMPNENSDSEVEPLKRKGGIALDFFGHCRRKGLN